MKIYQENLCFLGFHKWKKYWKSIPVIGTGDVTSGEFLHMECKRCGKVQVITMLPHEFGSRDTNRWIELKNKPTS